MQGNENKQKIAQILLEFGKKKMKEINKEGYFAKHNLKADRFIWENPLTFLIAVILNQSMKAEKVWEIPYLLNERLGHLDVNVIERVEG